MSSQTVQEIERAIGTLSSLELSELYAWLDGYEHPLDVRIAADLATGRMDDAIQVALDEEHGAQTRSL